MEIRKAGFAQPNLKPLRPIAQREGGSLSRRHASRGGILRYSAEKYMVAISLRGKKAMKKEMISLPPPPRNFEESRGYQDAKKCCKIEKLIIQNAIHNHNNYF